MSLVSNINKKIIASCGTPKASWILSVLSFTESCIFIIPPEVLLLPMCYAKRSLAWVYASITTVTSVLGAVAGYLIGMLLWKDLGPYAFEYIPGFEKYFDTVGIKYQEDAIAALFLSAFTPIPFKVFTVAAGVYSDKISLILLIFTSLAGRGTRYFIIAGIVYLFGSKAKEIIEKYSRIITILGIITAIGAVVYLLRDFLG